MMLASPLDCPLSLETANMGNPGYTLFGSGAPQEYTRDTVQKRDCTNPTGFRQKAY